MSSVDNITYTSEKILSGDNMLMYVGPASMEALAALSDATAIAEPGEDEGNNIVRLVGLVQGFNSSTSRPQRQVPELGSKAKYLVSSRGQKQMAIGRLMTDKGNVLRALYESYIKTNPQASLPKGKIWLSLDHPLFKTPIGIMMRIVRYTGDGHIELQRDYFSDVIIASIGTQITEGDRGIAENVSMLWSKTETVHINAATAGAGA